MTRSENHLPSAARRRERTRELREQRLKEMRQHTHSQVHRRRSRGRQKPWLLIGAILLAVIGVIALFVYIANQQKLNTDTATAAVWHSLTTIDPHLLAAVNMGSVTNDVRTAFSSTKNVPVLLDAAGKPQIFYMGGEFCPYCAAQRWAMIVALNRFGTFSQFTPIVSAEANVPTYSFYQSSYSSPYIDFTSVEVADNQQPAQSLQKLTDAQQQLINKYDAPPYSSSAGGYPFISIANQMLAFGAFYSYSILVGHTYKDIVDQLRNPSSNIAQGVLGAANYLTASICSVTHNKPAQVCTADPIPSIQSALPQMLRKVYTAPSKQPLALTSVQPTLFERRQPQVVR